MSWRAAIDQRNARPRERESQTAEKIVDFISSMICRSGSKRCRPTNRRPWRGMPSVRGPLDQRRAIAVEPHDAFSTHRRLGKVLDLFEKAAASDRWTNRGARRFGSSASARQRGSTALASSSPDLPQRIEDLPLLGQGEGFEGRHEFRRWSRRCAIEAAGRGVGHQKPTQERAEQDGPGARRPLEPRVGPRPLANISPNLASTLALRRRATDGREEAVDAARRHEANGRSALGAMAKRKSRKDRPHPDLSAGGRGAKA